jgi:peroxiredoxin
MRLQFGAGPALLFALLLGVRLPLLYTFAQVETNSDNQESLIPEGRRKPAPNFILTDAKRDTINLSTYKGKVVLLDFWATWCGGCKTEIPWYMEFDAKYRDRGLAVIGVSMDEDGWKTVRPFLALDRDPETGGHTAMKYPVVIGSDKLAKQYNLTSMPMTLLIDRHGRIAVSHTGMVNKDDWESKIRSLLK